MIQNTNAKASHDQSVEHSTTSTTYVTALDITGKGIATLNHFADGSSPGGVPWKSLKITIDGNAIEYDYIFDLATTHNQINLFFKFKYSFKVEVKGDDGAQTMYTNIAYGFGEL